MKTTYYKNIDCQKTYDCKQLLSKQLIANINCENIWLQTNDCKQLIIKTLIVKTYGWENKWLQTYDCEKTYDCKQLILKTLIVKKHMIGNNLFSKH